MSQWAITSWEGGGGNLLICWEGRWIMLHNVFLGPSASHPHPTVEKQNWNPPILYFLYNSFYNDFYYKKPRWVNIFGKNAGDWSKFSLCFYWNTCSINNQLLIRKKIVEFKFVILYYNPPPKNGAINKKNPFFSKVIDGCWLPAGHWNWL